MEDIDGISVVVTTLNMGSYLPDLLDSLVVQEQPFEVIIVDSMSTDDTVDTVLRYSTNFPFIRLVQKKCSRGEGRNIGVQHAKYDHILFTDGDAIANAFWVSKMKEMFENGAKVVAGKTVQMGYQPFEKLQRVELFFDDFDVTYPSVNLGFEKQLFEEIGGFDPVFVTAEDIDLNIRAVMHGSRIDYCPEGVIYHRARSTMVGFVEQAFWNGFGRKQLTSKHVNVWGHFKASEIFQPKIINFWYIIRGMSALVGYITCKIFGDEFLRINLSQQTADLG